MILRGKNFKIGAGVVTTPPPPPVTSGDIIITVTLSSIPTQAISGFTALKYDKKSMVHLEWDDASLGAMDAKALMSNRFFTDGAGNNKPFTAALAVNGMHQYNANDEVGLRTEGNVNYTQGLELIAAGWDIMNHSMYHDPYGNYNNGTNALLNIQQLEALYLQRTGYRMNALVVPTNYPNYMIEAANENYVVGSSEGTFDTYIGYPNDFQSTGRTNIIPDQPFTALKRHFTDAWASRLTDLKSYIDIINADAVNNRFLRVGSHNLIDIAAFTEFINHISFTGADKIWVTSAREWAEYRRTKILTVKSEILVDNVLTITLNQSAVSNRFRWKDLTLKITSDVGISNVAVSGADGFSFNASTKLINIFKQKTVFAQAVDTSQQIVMIKANQYQLNNFDYDLDYFYDGINQPNQNPNYGQIVDPNTVVYEFQGVATISKIVLRDGQGSTTNPMVITGITPNWQRIQLVSFYGQGFNTDEVFLFNDIELKYLTFTYPLGGITPEEVKVFGHQTGRTVVPFVKKKRYLYDHLGSNGFEWEFVSPANPFVIDPTLANEILSFTCIRHYLDWHTIEPVEGQYTFNPSHRGSWNLDVIYQWAKDNNILILADFKECPQWLQDLYPPEQQSKLSIPKDTPTSPNDAPSSYLKIAKALFQFAARYGSTVVPLNLVSVFTGIRYTNDPPNIKKTGLNLISYIEVENERDKWWVGRKGYQTGYEAGAMMSVCYDGHLGTLGNNVGIKTADPNMKVVMPGVANPRPDWLRGLIDYSKENRGYLPDGTVNLPFDVINIHDYSNDTGTSQGGNPTRGAAPEVSKVTKNILDTVWTVEQFIGRDVEIWNTEMGFDINQGSMLKAIAIGSRTIEQTQADWLIRTAMLHCRKGINRTLAYMLNDVNILSTERFSSCGMIGRPVQAVYQNFKTATAGFWYLESQSADPVVDIYKNDAGLHLYICCVPDEIGRTATYTLIKKNGSQVVLNLTETPVIITD